MNTIKPDQLHAFTMAELLVIMIISGVVYFSVMEGLSMFRKYGSAIADRIGCNSGFFADYCRLEDMVRHADSIRAANKGECEIYYEGRIRYRLIEKDSLLVAYADGFQDTMSVKVAKLSVASGNNRIQIAENLTVIVVTSKGEELPLSFRMEQGVINEIVVGMIERENEYQMDDKEQKNDD